MRFLCFRLLCAYYISVWLSVSWASGYLSPDSQVFSSSLSVIAQLFYWLHNNTLNYPELSKGVIVQH